MCTFSISEIFVKTTPHRLYCISSFLIGMDECTVTHTYSKSKDQSCKVANPTRGQLKKENEYFPVSVRVLRIWSRETGLAVPSRVRLLIPYSGGIWCSLTGFLPISTAASIYLFKPPYAIGSVPSLLRYAQLRTDGVHCRESAGTEPVSPWVVPNMCCHCRSPWTN